MVSFSLAASRSGADGVQPCQAATNPRHLCRGPGEVDVDRALRFRTSGEGEPGHRSQPDRAATAHYM